MGFFMRRISLAFAAGTIGGLVNALLVWYLGNLGIPHKFGVSIAPALTPAFIYARMVWGGLWGLLFILPLWRGGFWSGVLVRGILLGLIPTFFQLFYVFPFLQKRGMMGLSLGQLTPLFVFFYNAVWGVFTAIWLRLTGEN